MAPYICLVFICIKPPEFFSSWVGIIPSGASRLYTLRVFTENRPPDELLTALREKRGVRRGRAVLV